MLAFWAVAIAGFAQHTVVLKNGTKIQGVVMELQNDQLTLAVNRELTTVHLKDVTSIFFTEYVPYDGGFVNTEPEKTIRSGEYVIRYQMKDRKIVQAPKISIGTEDRGTVVVTVKINRSGTVTSAVPGAPGSTTSSEYLYTKAKFAAMGARFNEHPKGPIETVGTITITY